MRRDERKLKVQKKGIATFSCIPPFRKDYGEKEDDYSE